jgi:hypothetical protein
MFLSEFFLNNRDTITATENSGGYICLYIYLYLEFIIWIKEIRLCSIYEIHLFNLTNKNILLYAAFRAHYFSIAETVDILTFPYPGRDDSRTNFGNIM